MSIIAPGIMVITVFLLASALMFGTFLTASATQGDSLKDLATTNTAQAGDQLNITSAVMDDQENDSGDLTVTVDNTGSRSTPDFSRMDVILEYTDTSDNAVVIYIDHSTAAPLANEWTVSGITPDSFNPNMWDSDEVITIDILVSPLVKRNTAALVVVVTPWGISDTSPVTNP